MATECTQCGAPAPQTRDTCTTCHLTGLLKSVQAEARPTLASPPPVPKAAPAPRPQPEPEVEPAPEPRPYASAVVTGITQGLKVGTDAVLSGAAKLAATLGAIPKNVSTAQTFFDFNQKHFYNHMRVILKALDGKKRIPGRKRTDQVRNLPPGSQSASNKNLALALRFIRIYLQVEQKPLALMIGRSQAAIWHIECAHHNIQPHVVAAYGDALNIEPDRIYRYANALGRGPAKDLDAVDMITKFVDIVIRGK